MERKKEIEESYIKLKEELKTKFDSEKKQVGDHCKTTLDEVEMKLSILESSS